MSSRSRRLANAADFLKGSVRLLVARPRQQRRARSGLLARASITSPCAEPGVRVWLGKRRHDQAARTAHRARRSLRRSPTCPATASSISSACRRRTSAMRRRSTARSQTTTGRSSGRAPRRPSAISASTRSASAVRSRSGPGCWSRSSRSPARSSTSAWASRPAPTSCGSCGRTASVRAEFDAKADQAVVTEQRLKGSCPFLFAYDGNADGVREGRGAVGLGDRPAHQHARLGEHRGDRGVVQDRARPARAARRLLRHPHHRRAVGDLLLRLISR